MGSGRNKNFDPKDPNSKPYEERKTGMGRFLQRWGSGVDSGELNNEYSAKRRENEAGREQQIALQKSQQEFTTGRDEANNAEDWKRSQSHLANQAALEQIRQGFQLRMQAANMAQNQSKQNQDEARRLFELTGTWDPIKQQEVMEKIRTQRMDEPRSLSGGIVYDPSSNQYIHNEQPGYAIGPDGKSMIHNPGGLRSTSRNLQSGMGMPAAGSGISSQPPANGGRQLQGDPAALREALGITSGISNEAPKENRLMSMIRQLGSSIATPLNRDFMDGVRGDFNSRFGSQNESPDIVSNLLEKRKSQYKRRMLDSLVDQ